MVLSLLSLYPFLIFASMYSVIVSVLCVILALPLQGFQGAGDAMSPQPQMSLMYRLWWQLSELTVSLELAKFLEGFDSFESLEGCVWAEGVAVQQVL